MVEPIPGQGSLLPEEMGYDVYRVVPKFVAFGDAHIGTYKYPIRDRIIDTLEELVDFVQRVKPPHVFFTGDAFRVRVPSAADVGLFGHYIKQLSIDSHVYMIPGNHDIAGQGATTLDVYDNIDNVDVIRYPFIKDELGMQIVFVPWLPAKALMQSVGMLTHEAQSNQELVRNLIVALKKKLDPNKFSILVAHCTAFGAELHDKVSTIYTNDVLWTNDMFDGFDICLLGHLHKPQQVPGIDNTWYTGSPCPISFNETEQQKSFIYYDGAVQQIPLKSAPMFAQLTAEDAKTAVGSDNLFLQILSDEPIGQDDVPRCAWYEVITRPPQREIRVRLDAEQARNMTPKEAIFAWLDEEGHDDQKDNVAALLDDLA